ncbi:MAG: O-antigen ligase family protein [bacterium]|nr:O-antigen ligase family protein [bacterium]
MSWFKLSAFFLRLSALFVAIVVPSTLFPFIVGKYAWFRGSVAISLGLFCIGVLANHEAAKPYLARLRATLVSPIGISVILFSFFFILAGLFGVDPAASFWSNFERGEGGLQVLHLSLFFFLLSSLLASTEDWRRMLRWVVAGGVLMVVYGFFAAYGYQGFVGATLAESGSGFRFQGSIGNPAYVGALCIFFLGYLAYLLHARYRERKLLSLGSFFVGLLGAGFIAVLFFSKTRGALVALVVAAAVAIAYFAWFHRAWRKRLLAGGALLIVLLVVAVQFRQTQFIQSLPISRIFDISIGAETFQTRGIMWGVAYRGFLDRPVLGWGPENYIQVFDRHFDTAYYVPGNPFGAWFDRAHSIIFDYLVETGALGLVSYLGMFVVFFWQFFRTRKIELTRRLLTEESILIGLAVAYLVQGVVLFDVLPISYNLFFFLALGGAYVTRIQDEKRKEIKEKGGNPLKQAA